MRVLLCECVQARLLAEAQVTAALAALNAASAEVVRVPDLCRLTATGDPLLRQGVGSGELAVVLACHARAVRALVQQAGVPAATAQALPVVDLRGGDAAAIPAAVEAALATAAAAKIADSATPLPAGPALALPQSWVPWFPVLDPQRCTHCGKCKDFCLFGVYARDAAGKVQVRCPQNCKINCPACARLCPEIAIIFPKYDQSPLNGAPIADEAAERARAQADAKELTEQGGDAMAILARRRQQCRRPLLKG